MDYLENALLKLSFIAVKVEGELTSFKVESTRGVRKQKPNTHLEFLIKCWHCQLDNLQYGQVWGHFWKRTCRNRTYFFQGRCTIWLDRSWTCDSFCVNVFFLVQLVYNSFFLAQLFWVRQALGTLRALLKVRFFFGYAHHCLYWIGYNRYIVKPRSCSYFVILALKWRRKQFTYFLITKRWLYWTLACNFKRNTIKLLTYSWVLCSGGFQSAFATREENNLTVGWTFKIY